MLSDKLKELEATRGKLAALEQAVQAELRSELAALPAKYGFENVSAFLAAVRRASGSRRGRPPKAAKGLGRARRRRATVTDATRAEVKKLVEGGNTGSEIAKAVGVSLPTVQNIKKSLGLVRKQKGA